MWWGLRVRREQGARGPGGLGQGVTPTQLPSGACVPSCCEQEEPTYFAIWGDNKAFNEVIISPAMLHEHLPYVVMEGLNKVRDPTRPRAVTSPQRSQHFAGLSPSPCYEQGCGLSEE